MKKIILAFAVVAFTTIGAQAQTSFGLKGGMAAANWKTSGDMEEGTSLSSKIGFYIGGFAEAGISDNFAIQPELFYSGLGTILKSDGTKYKINFGYISLPVLVKYKKEGFAAFLGPQVSYLISAKEASHDIKDDYKKIELAGVIGAGYTLTNGFGVDARYQLGISDIIKDNDSDETLKNNAFMIGVHYKFSK